MGPFRAAAHGHARFDRPLVDAAVLVGLLALAALLLSGPGSAARDLTVTVMPESRATDNSSVSYNLTAFNTGDSAAGPVTIQLYVGGTPTGPLHDLGNIAAGANESAIQSLALACGVYEVNATVDPSDQVPETDETNNNASIALLVHPVAALNSTISGPPGNILLALDASGSHGCGPLNVTWDIGGETRYGAAVNYTPPAGPLNITLTVRSTANPLLTSTHTVGLTIPNGAPTLSVSIPDATIQTLTPLALTVEADDPDGSVESYSIDFGDGNTTSTLAEAAAHEYRAGGNYTVRVRVTDNLGAVNETTVAVAVANRAPFLDTEFSFWFTYPGTPVEFNASRSFDPEGLPLVVRWEFGDGTNATGAVVNHTYSAARTYDVTLTIADSSGETRTEHITVRVDPAPSSGWALPVIGGTLGLLAAVAFLFLLIRRRRSDDGPTPADKPTDGKEPGEGSSSKPPSP